MGVVRMALVNSMSGKVENVILIDPEAGDFTPPDGYILVDAEGVHVNPGDWYLSGVFVRGAFERVEVTPTPATVNAVVTVTATLPADTPDAEVTFQVDGGQSYTEPVVNGQASHAYAFSLPGTYRIQVSSAHHGQAVVEVIVQ
jgi:hypothetical protein